MRVHVFAAGVGVADTREAEPHVRLAELVAVEEDEKVYPVDEEGELDLDLTLEALLTGRPGHLAVSTCREVAVTVGYAGRDEVVRVHPATRLRRVRRRAIEQFGISPADAADLVLRVPGGAEDLDLTAPVSSIVPKHTCAVTVDLVHTVRPQG
ncbi:hypothetical protein ACFQS1_35100 [Paractinoplanes rhizophilus]|uniref:Uncharacterized protein n=1 Tax=Paractinoplanes rhizophilus TaxID=1416877 RepID=A0ABW2I319_9ACTN